MECLAALVQRIKCLDYSKSPRFFHRWMTRKFALHIGLHWNGTRRQIGKQSQQPLCIVTFIARSLSVIVCTRIYTHTRSGKLMKSTCACATFSKKMEASKEKHRYFMHFSSRRWLFFFFLSLSVSSSLFAFILTTAIPLLLCHFFSATVICLHFATQLFVLSSCKLPLTQA